MILSSLLLCLALFAAMLVCLEAGFRHGMRFSRTAGGDETSILDSAVFALLGLLLGFAFAGAVDRFGHRRELIVEEANAITTAHFRVSLLDAADQESLRPLLHSYIGSRLHVYDIVDSGGDPQPAFEEAARLQNAMWDAAVAGVRREGFEYAAETLLPAFNDMFSVATERRVALNVHMSPLILFLLFSVSLLAALLAGNGMARPGTRHLLHGAIFAAAVSLTVYAILDLDHPRTGFIRLDAADRILRELGTSL